MGIERRLEKLEAGAASSAEWVTPIEVRAYCTTIERLHARREGRQPPPYSEEEIAHFRQSDIEIVADGGVVGQYRKGVGWQSEKARELLDEWEREARQRVEAGRDLPPERWHEVWGDDM